MSIYTNEQIINESRQLGRDELLRVVERIVGMRMSNAMRTEISKIIMKTDGPEEIVFLSEKRSVPRMAILRLSESPMLEYVRPLIEAALDSRGPYQSTEIMLLAAQIKGGKAFYITADGISQAWKNQAGYILTMAGFERSSHYDRETRRPIKAWKTAYGWGHLDVDMREIEVMKAIEEAKTGETKPKAKPAPSILKDFL